MVNNCVPFLEGGAEHLAEALAIKLREYGHQAAVVRVPFRWNPPEKILDHMLACRLMRLPNIDLAIAFKFPAFYIPHPNKILWILHQFRQAYDMWGTRYQDLPDNARGVQIRDAIRQADNSYLAEAKKIYTNSTVTGDRLRRFNGIESDVLLPPLMRDSMYLSNPHEDYVFCPGRVNGAKRQLLLVQAMKYCKTPVRLLVAGKAEWREWGFSEVAQQGYGHTHHCVVMAAELIGGAITTVIEHDVVDHLVVGNVVVDRE